MFALGFRPPKAMSGSHLEWRQVAIPIDFHGYRIVNQLSLANWLWTTLTRWEREVAPMISPHVDIQPSGSLDLLQPPLRSGRPSQVLQSTYHPQHGRQSSPTCLPTKTGMRSHSVVNITIDGPVNPDAIRLGKIFGFAARTHEAAEDFVARFDLDWAASVVDGCGYRR